MAITTSISTRVKPATRPRARERGRAVRTTRGARAAKPDDTGGETTAGWSEEARGKTGAKEKAGECIERVLKFRRRAKEKGLGGATNRARREKGPRRSRLIFPQKRLAFHVRRHRRAERKISGNERSRFCLGARRAKANRKKRIKN